MKLYLVPVPIGNLGDITLRAIEVLKSVDFIIAEDTRYSLKLLNHLDIRKPVTSYFKPKEHEKAARIINRLTSGEASTAALITDSGSPGISDPGFILVRKAIDEGAEVIPLPGPTAFVPALTVSGIDPGRFLFIGFPPRKSGELRRFLKDYVHFPFPLVFYESPRRVNDFLKAAAEVLGDRTFALAKEISKKNEKIIRGNLANLDGVLAEETLLGEMVVIIDKAGEDEINREQKLKLDSMDDLFSYFKENHNISKNQLKKILMRKE